jgi:DNA mismatch repair protein MutL
LNTGEDLRQRVTALFPMLDVQRAEDLIRVFSQDKGIRVQGLLGHPQLARSSGKFQYVFLNGRFIRDKTVMHAIKEAYRGLLEPNRYPAVFLYLDMPLDAYDVNVHPTKTEVRFYQSQLVHSQIKGTLREALLGVDMNALGRVPAASLDIQDTPAPVLTPRRTEVREAMTDFFRQQRPAMDSPRVASPSASYETSPGTKTYSPSPAVKQRVVPEEVAPPARRFLQVHDSYIVAETEDGFVVVDQHALHEKILFERLCQSLRATGLSAQRLLIPATIKLSDAQAHSLLEEHGDLLDQLGIEIEAFGPQTYAIQSFPTQLDKADPVDFVQQLVDVLDQQQGASAEQLLDAVLSMAACKAAIKAGQALSRSEIEQLLDDGLAAESSARCPHGRPTTLRFSLTSLANQFLRT